MAYAYMHESIPEPQPLIKTIVLEMSMDEAELLYDILTRIGGDATGLRRHADSIRCALLRCVDVPIKTYDERHKTLEGTIWMKR